ATPADIQPLADLLTVCFHPQVSRRRWLAPLIRLGIIEDLRSRLRAPAPDYLCLVALRGENQEIVGTVEITLKGWFSSSRRHCYLSNLAVSPTHRRRGVARQLLAHCEQIARGWNCQRVALHVLASNTGAETLYRTLGYQPSREGEAPWFSLGNQRRLLQKRLS
ncbi:MAG: GNAT family N-acetyltransferase, partial [Cyanobacteriota bacterium]